MKTIAIRFSDYFAPECGTIFSHEDIIKQCGYVWFGKIGHTKMSKRVINEILANGPVNILMIKTQSKTHYLAKVEAILEKCPELNRVPQYYAQKHRDCSNWFKITVFTPIAEEELKKFFTTSGNSIFDIYKKSMGSYFVVEYKK